MPNYEYECKCGHRFEEYHRMDERHNAFCPMCKRPVRLKISLSNFRFAEPLTVLQDLGNYPDGTSKGYKEVGWRPDSGISPRPGQPYKTAKDVEREEYRGLKEV